MKIEGVPCRGTLRSKDPVYVYETSQSKKAPIAFPAPLQDFEH